MCIQGGREGEGERKKGKNGERERKHILRGQKTAFRSLFSPSTISTRNQTQVCVTSTFTC